MSDATAAVSPSIWRNAVILAVMAAICSGLVALTYVGTKARIAANEKAYIEQSLEPALAGILYDNDLIASTLTLAPPHGLPGRDAAVLYRVLAAGEPVAALFVVSADDGFVGPIRLLIGVEVDGVISGVRVVSHRETPGIGDLIDDTRSDWILQFAQTSLAEPDRSVWKVRRDGGVIDQLSGASITSRAVVNAIRETLLFFEGNREAVFAAAGDNETEQKHE